MTVTKLKRILESVFDHELNVEDAWELIDEDREAPNEYSKEYWIPLEDR